MDVYEATRIVFSRIQNLDPENTSKIMGFLLIQDHGEKEMIRLALGPEALVHSVILKARKDLGLSSNSQSTPSTPSPFLSTNPISISRQNSTLSSASSRLGIPFTSQNHTSVAASPWAALSEIQNTDEISSQPAGSSSLSMNSSSLPFYCNGASDMVEDFQLQDQLSFLNDGSHTLGLKNPNLFYAQPELSSSPTGGDGSYGNWGGSLHRRSCSVNEVCLGPEDSAGFGWKPCLYFARGYCKNGTSCRFLHGGLRESAALMGWEGASLVGSPSKLEIMDQCSELLRTKSAQQQRLAAASQLMASASSFPYSPKVMNFLHQQQQNDSQREAAALMMGEDMHKFGRSRLERSDFSMNSMAGMVNPASRQIYLTFPADSTFREEDVSNYFSIYGPVQDVRIPYQQKRMFGFVTFLYPDTVKLILAKGNPHFVCDARVLVKPYKEKGKVLDKKQQQQVERGDFSPCGTPTGLDSRDPYDLQLGARMFYGTQDMLWRRKLEEQADLQQTLELQSRRLMGLQLLDVKKHHHHRAHSTGSPIPSPTHSPSFFNQNLVLPLFRNSPEENCCSPLPAVTVTPADQQLQETANAIEKELTGSEESDNGKGSPYGQESDLQESLEHHLPDSLYASPKASGEHLSAFSNTPGEAEKDAAVSASSSVNNNLVSPSLLSASSTLDMASFKSFNCQMPRFSSGPAAIGMYAGTGSPTCPVGI